MSQISSMLMFPECLMFFSFFRSLGGSVRKEGGRLEVSEPISKLVVQFLHHDDPRRTEQASKYRNREED